MKRKSEMSYTTKLYVTICGNYEKNIVLEYFWVKDGIAQVYYYRKPNG